jgi:hypothetical protein
LQGKLQILDGRLRIVGHDLAGVDSDVLNLAPHQLAKNAAALLRFVEQLTRWCITIGD